MFWNVWTTLILRRHLPHKRASVLTELARVKMYYPNTIQSFRVAFIKTLVSSEKLCIKIYIKWMATTFKKIYYIHLSNSCLHSFAWVLERWVNSVAARSVGRYNISYSWYKHEVFGPTFYRFFANGFLLCIKLTCQNAIPKIW